MNKYLVGMLSLLIVTSLMLIGCSTENAVAGEATASRACLTTQKDCGFVTAEQLSITLNKIKNQNVEVFNNLKIECKQFVNLNPSHAECIAKGYQTCAGATLIWTVKHGGVYDLVTWPLNCDDPYDESKYKTYIKNRLQLNGAESVEFYDDDALVTCCRIPKPFASITGQ